jgi:hypothetical protein
VAAGNARLEQCELNFNIVRMASVTAVDATGGAISVAANAMLSLVESRLWSNDAGGIGNYESFNAYVDRAASNQRARASQVACAGWAVIERCTFLPTGLVVSAGPMDESAVPHAGSALIVAGAGGRVALRGCAFSSIVPGVLLKLTTSDAEAVVRGCTGTNMTIVNDAGTTKLGIVASSFDPPLPDSLVTVQPPSCGTVLAGESLCDARAQCKSSSSGGVTCACAGHGLGTKAGMAEDGQFCQQESRVSMLVESRSAVLQVTKPSTSTERLAIQVRAEGESAIVPAYSMRMSRLQIIRLNGVEVRETNSSRNWSAIVEQRFSLDGHEVLFVTPMSNDGPIDLSVETKTLSATKEYSLQIRVNCTGAPTSAGAGGCVQDGDTVVTEIDLGTPLGPVDLRSTVRIVTQIEAMVCCEHAQAWVEGDIDAVPVSSVLRVHALAIDVDQLSISHSRASIAFSFGNESLSVLWVPGSNEHVAEVAASLTERPGEFQLVVTASNAWSSRAEKATSCELLRTTVLVSAKAGFNSTWILVGAASASTVIVVGLLIALRRWRKRLQAILLMLFSEAAELIGALLMECADWITDFITCYRVLHGEIKVQHEEYKIVYAMCMVLGTFVMVISVVYRVRNARKVVKHLKRVLGPHQRGDCLASKGRQQLLAFEWELTQTRRAKVVLSLAVMTVVAEGTTTS